ncbi:TetR/AcrR family transcriptional regulator [Achromobacter pulmonis]|uniref:TetR/AcrR family transcriptional regulator n=1 Tax=Achromobacter pulmonis TaxID=1389932 RepID=UPI0034D97033
MTKVPPRVGPCTPEEILDAAEWCFLHLGVAGTSTALIAARTRCARSLVSAHFPSPRSILALLRKLCDSSITTRS